MNILDKIDKAAVKFIILLIGICIGLSSCTKPIEPEAELIEDTATVVSSPYAFDLTQFDNIANVIQVKEIAGSETYRTWNYKDLGELDALIEQGYLVLQNNSCCIDEANVYIFVSTWDGERYEFNFTLTKD